MKTKHYILVLLIGISATLSAQIKIWNKVDCKPTKVKGILSRLEKPHLKKDTTFIPKTITSALIPYVIKYGNAALKKVTSKNEQDYIFETTYINQQTFSFDLLSRNPVIIKANQEFYKKGASKADTLSSYAFVFTKRDHFLEITLDQENIVENYSTVKVKSNYDFIISNFDISVSAIINQEVNAAITQQKIVDLGTTTINMVHESFRSKDIKPIIMNSGGLLIPNVSEGGKKIEVTQLIVKITSKQVNPYGTTSNSLNDFLEKNSDTNEAFLNSILLKED